MEKVLLNQAFPADLAPREAIADRIGSQSLVQEADVLAGEPLPDLQVPVRRVPVLPKWSEVAERGQELGAGKLLLQSVDGDGIRRGLSPSRSPVRFRPAYLTYHDVRYGSC